MKTLIKNVTILPLNEKNEEITNGFIGIEGQIISYVGKEMPGNFKGAYVIDGNNKVALPGFVNTHCHIPMTLLRGYSDGYPLHQWLFEKIFPVEEKMDDESVYWGSLLGMAEMILSGTTTFSDMYFLTDAVARATEKSGLRANLARCLSNDTLTEGFSENKAVAESRELIEKWHGKGEGRIRFDISAHAPYTSTPYFLEQTAQMAHDMNLGMQIHVSETEKENYDIKKQYGKTPTRFLYDLGYFQTRTVAAHCVYLEDEDIEIFKNHSVFIAHNPTSNLKLGSGVAPIKRYLENGIAVSLGTDGASSNNNLNMFEEINLAGLLMTGITKDAAAIQSHELLKMGTLAGAKALGLERVGELKPGNLADIQLIDYNKPHFYPLHNLANHLCYSANASDVDTVIVNGKLLMEKRELKTLDFEEIKYHVRENCKKLF